MSKQYGTRFTTGCGHSWRRRYPKWKTGILAGATTDCRECGELLAPEHIGPLCDHCWAKAKRLLDMMDDE